LHTLDTAWCQDWPSLLLYVRYSSTPSACLHGAALCPACQLTRASAPILAQTRPRRAKLPRTGWCRWSGLIGGHLGHVPLTFIELGVRALSRPASKTRDSNTEFTSEMQHSARWRRWSWHKGAFAHSHVGSFNGTFLSHRPEMPLGSLLSVTQQQCRTSTWAAPTKVLTFLAKQLTCQKRHSISSDQ
jgi:hypothetical protein